MIGILKKNKYGGEIAESNIWILFVGGDYVLIFFLPWCILRNWKPKYVCFEVWNWLSMSYSSANNKVAMITDKTSVATPK